MIPPRKMQANRRQIPGHGRTRLIRFLQLEGLRTSLRQTAFFVIFMYIPWLRARLYLRQLEHQCGPARKSAGKGAVVVSTHYGNTALVEHFLSHHRGLGIRDFVFLDLSAEGGLAGDLANDRSCAVWRPRNTREPADVTTWLNGLRNRYAAKRWCLSIDTADAFVFNRCKTRKLQDFTDFLESESRDNAFAVLMEMYADRPADDLAPSARREPPIRALPYFDPFGFVTNQGRYRSAMVRGGPQRRTLYRTLPGQCPPLNRIPLVRWRWYFRYLEGNRLILPTRLNHPHAHWHSSPTGCILSFALLHDRATLEDAARWEAGRAAGEREPSFYLASSRLLDVRLKNEVSRRYNDPQDLVDSGLLNPGQWF